MIDQELMEECKVFMNKTREARPLKTIDHQKAKVERLWLKNKGGCSNIENQYMYHGGENQNSKQTAKTTTTTTSNWVKNMFSTTHRGLGTAVGPQAKLQ